MGKVERIEEDVRALTRQELSAFREWFRQFDSEEWDRQIEKDVRAGKLDKVADEALAAHKAGKSKEL